MGEAMPRLYIPQRPLACRRRCIRNTIVRVPRGGGIRGWSISLSAYSPHRKPGRDVHHPPRSCKWKFPPSRPFFAPLRKRVYHFPHFQLTSHSPTRWLSCYRILFISWSYAVIIKNRAMKFKIIKLIKTRFFHSTRELFVWLYLILTFLSICDVILISSCGLFQSRNTVAPLSFNFFRYSDTTVIRASKYIIIVFYAPRYSPEILDKSRSRSQRRNESSVSIEQRD